MHTTSFGPELTSISFGCQEEVNMNLKNTREYGSQFSGEKNCLKIRYLVAKILSKNGVLSFCIVRDHLF